MESSFKDVYNKVLQFFNCFDKASNISKTLALGQFDGDANKLVQQGKDALNTITSTKPFGILKTPSDKLITLGENSLGPLMKNPINVAKSGGDLNKAGKSMLNQTKDIFGQGAQDALKNTKGAETISQENYKKINKKFKLALESKQFKRIFNKSVIQVENAFKSLIKNEVITENNGWYKNITNDINITTSTGNITIKKINNNLIYQENFNNSNKKTIIYENTESTTMSVDGMTEYLKSLSPSEQVTVAAAKKEAEKLVKDKGMTFSQAFKAVNAKYYRKWKAFRLLQKRKVKRIKNKISDTANNVKTSVENAAKAVWNFIKKIYRPLFNILLFITTQLLKIIYAILGFILDVIEKLLKHIPYIKDILEAMGGETLGSKLLKHSESLNIGLSINDMLTPLKDQTDKFSAWVCQWTAVAGCIGFTIWIVKVGLNLISGNSSSDNTSSKPQKIKKSKYAHHFN